jgi:shikimate kinase
MIAINKDKVVQQLTQTRINELKSLLASTDFKELPHYQTRSGKTDEEMAQILAERKAWYDELKELIK